MRRSPLHSRHAYRVKEVLDFVAAGINGAEVLSDLPYLEKEDIRACLAFAAADGGPPRPRCRRSLKILIDAQLPPGRKVMLAAAGHEANHVVDVGLRDAADTQVWEYAVREGIAVLT